MGTKIAKIEVTNDKISGRGGLSFFLRYMDRTNLYPLLTYFLGKELIASHKGLRLEQFLKQMFAFFIDGSHMALSGFDKKQKDKSYAALLENNQEDMASSHQVKRFFQKLSCLLDAPYRHILHQLFIWRLKIEKPALIELMVDTMVLDNDLSRKKDGNELTYKKKFGFQPLHIIWNHFIVDAMFRKGSAHSNHGTDFTDCVRDIVELIREKYSEHVPIILCADGGFSGNDAFTYFEETLKIHYIINSRIYASAGKFIDQLPQSAFNEFSKGQTAWEYTEFGNRLNEWEKFRRCIFTRVSREEDGQYVLAPCKSDSFIYTNLGKCQEADQKLKEVCGNNYFEAKTIIAQSHQRGEDELVHRSIKELATKEQMPFKRFGMNRAYYFLLVITHFLFEAYKRDVAPKIIHIKAYPNTFRRLLIDFAVKFTFQARYVVMKVGRAVYEDLKIDLLWKNCQSPPAIQII